MLAYTINGAYTSFEEDRKGSLSVGKLADLVLLSADITEQALEDIEATRVMRTIIGGKAAYQRQ